jgi:hypothetical protein
LKLALSLGGNRFSVNPYVRLSQNFSFGKATLILFEKAGFRPLFRKPLPKPTEFWERLMLQKAAILP